MRVESRIGVFAVAMSVAALLAWFAWPHFGRWSPLAIVPSAAPLRQADASVDLIARASSALAACPLSTPPAVPDGAAASLEQMTAARAAFQAYDAATNAYVKCVDSAVDRIAAEYRTAAPDSELQRLRALGTSAHNTAIDQEQAIAEQFNMQVRAFKAKHPK